MTGLVTVITIIAVLVILAVWIISVYNGLISKRNDAKEGYSTMDVYLKKRFDMIPNLVETVKGYAEHEKTTLGAVTKARNQVATANTVEDKIQGESMLTGALRQLFAVAEAYPDLKANTGFINLQNEISQVENDIANARKYYNGTVKILNNKVEKFPSNIIAGMFHFKQMPMFEVSDSNERENVKVKFN